MSDDDEVYMVPVPKPHLEAVYALLASRMSESARPPEEGGAEVGGQGMWNEAMIKKLKGSLHLFAARSLLDAAAAVAPEEISMQHTAQEHDIPPNQLRAQMGALSKLAVKLYDKRIWPVSVRYGDDGQAYYKMPTEVAEWWKNIS